MNQNQVNAQNTEGFLLRLAKSAITRLSNEVLIQLHRWLEDLLRERKAPGWRRNYTELNTVDNLLNQRVPADQSVRNEDEQQYTLVGDVSRDFFSRLGFRRHTLPVAIPTFYHETPPVENELPIAAQLDDLTLTPLPVPDTLVEPNFCLNCGDPTALCDCGNRVDFAESTKSDMAVAAHTVLSLLGISEYANGDWWLNYLMNKTPFWAVVRRSGGRFSVEGNFVNFSFGVQDQEDI